MSKIPNIAQWLDSMLSIGKFTFSFERVQAEFHHLSKVAIQHGLLRLVKKNKIMSVHKGFYCIIPPTYGAIGVLPPILFIDDLMKVIQKPYYVGLLNAAALYGASHQQPQTLSVFTSFPTLRNTKKNGILIKYISIAHDLNPFTQPIKTETGYVTISSSVLTAFDLVQYEKHIGGLNRATTVLSELVEKLNPDEFTFDLLKRIPVTVIQRFGYLLEMVLNYTDLANHIYSICQQNQLTFYLTPLKANKKTNGFPINAKWKISINTLIEIDDL